MGLWKAGMYCLSKLSFPKVLILWLAGFVKWHQVTKQNVFQHTRLPELRTLPPTCIHADLKLLSESIFSAVFVFAGIDSPEDLCVLYSNRAACYLKDGNSTDCIQDCTRLTTHLHTRSAQLPVTQWPDFHRMTRATVLRLAWIYCKCVWLSQKD